MRGSRCLEQMKLREICELKVTLARHGTLLYKLGYGSQFGR